MLVRPGAGPGCSWMQRLDQKLTATVDTSQPRTGRWMLWFWLVWAAFMLSSQGLTRGLGPIETISYHSEIHIAGLPLVAYGHSPRGIIAVGNLPVGVIALGGLPVGVVAVGGMAAGVVALGGVSLGLMALAGLAFGGWAVGGGAAGYYAFGGLAVGGYAYSANGVAFGYFTASGRQKEKLLG